MYLFCFLSGGVDSSVAAHLAIDSKVTAIGISHINWPESKCCELNALRQCESFCQNLNIPYYKIDCLIPFCKKVVDNFCNTYFCGETPNPCVICNEKIRFDFLIKTVLKNLKIKADQDYKIVTGHYAQVEYKRNQYFLKKGIDQAKDQSYMLYRLNQAQLSRCFFPLGRLTKKAVRELACKWQLESAQKSDSQDACFLDQPYPEFIVRYLEKQPKKGVFIDENGKVLGEHQGIIYYTRGQRKGLNLPDGPWFVKQIDFSNNQIVLARKENLYLKKFKEKI
ncbi:MAG: tRNA 2-thiouridine(34) synthase MnmA [Candidatus Margulisiibacteriota bacterium]|jgi:tRNA-specific 2-thiouridylase